MPTKQKHLIFWTALKNSNKDLFSGTPSEAQYYNIVNENIAPLKVRLDVYCTKKHYESKGYLTICIMLADNKASQLKTKFPSMTNYMSEDRDGRLFILRNWDVPCFIGNNVNLSAIAWFTENVKKINDILM